MSRDNKHTDIVDNKYIKEDKYHGDGLIILAHPDGDIVKNKNKYMDVINSNELAKKYHLHLSKRFERRINKHIYNTNEEQKINKKNINVQYGGVDPLIIFGVSVTSASISAVAAYFIYKYLSIPRCLKKYPSVINSPDISVAKVMSNFIPISWFGESNDPEEQAINAINTITGILNIFAWVYESEGEAEVLLNTFSMLRTSVLSAVGTTAKVATKTATSVVSGGTVSKGINLMEGSLLSLRIIKILVISLNLMTDKNALKLFADIFTIDFRAGPFGVACWMDYLTNLYKGTKSTYYEICNLLQEIARRLSELLGIVIGTMCPSPFDAIVPTLVPELYGHFKSGATELFDYVLIKMFNYLPYDKQELFKNPKRLNAFFRSIIMNNLVRQALPVDIFNALDKYMSTFGNIICKFFAFSFTISRLLKMCVRLESDDDYNAFQDFKKTASEGKLEIDYGDEDKPKKKKRRIKRRRKKKVKKNE
jgi:hypothetical protein